MQLAIDELYKKCNNLSNTSFLMTIHEFGMLNRYKFLLRTNRRKKILSLIDLKTRPNFCNDEHNKPIDFKNMSMHYFTTKQDLLNKGSSYIPPPPIYNQKSIIAHKTEIQSCFDRIFLCDNKLANSASFMQFISGGNNIMVKAFNIHNQMMKNNSIWKTLEEIKMLQNDTLCIMPWDKTKRLIAMDTSVYNEMLKNTLNRDDRIVKFKLLISRQHKFNTSLMNTAENYKYSKTFKLLMDC